MFRLLLKIENYKKYYNLINVDRYGLREVSIIYSSLKTYFTKYPADTTLDEFTSWFYLQYPRLKPEEITAYGLIFQQIKEADVLPNKAQDLLQEIEARSNSIRLAETALAFSEGKASRDALGESWKHLSTDVPTTTTETTYVTDDLDAILNATYLKPGLRWRLKSLNRSLGSLRQGDFGFVFARPETGKTTFLASEITYMAGQVDAPIIWFNNEEQGNKVKVRCYQAALGCTREYLISNRKKATARYLQLTGGHIRIVDTGALFRGEVETILGNLVPSLIVFDSIDKIRGFNADRSDLVMGSIYQWARDLAKSMCPVIGICQADASGDGVRWLTMANVAEAKTAKQAEADWILGIGKTYNEDMEYVRHFHLSKNKLAGDEDTDPSWRHGKWDVLLQPELARYKDFG